MRPKTKPPSARARPHPALVSNPSHPNTRSRGLSFSNDKLPRTVRSAKSTSRPRTRGLSGEGRRKVGIEELEELWDSHAVPTFHRDEFRTGLEGGTLVQREEAIQREVGELQKGTEPILQVLRAVTKREDLISQLYELESRVGETADEVIQKEAAEVLEKLRFASLSAIESILAWRLRLSKPLCFLWQDQNYLIKMRSDLNFLQQSALSNYFFFSETASDPFLLQAAGPRTFSRM